MSLAFHPKCLHKLLKFKKKMNLSLLKSILILSIDNTKHVDISFLEEFIFSHIKFTNGICDLNFKNGISNGISNATNINTTNINNNTTNINNNTTNININTTNINAIIKDYILKLFIKKQYKNHFICFVKSIPKNSLHSLILENRKNEPSILGNENSFNFIENMKLSIKSGIKSGIKSDVFKSCIESDINSYINLNISDINSDLPSNILDLPSNVSDLPSLNLPSNVSDLPSLDLPNQSITLKSDISKQSVLNFSKFTSPIPKLKIDKFVPLKLKNFIINKKETLRKRDDLINPVKLQFIKHYDQIRPPIYRKRERIIRMINSYKRIEGIISYEDDSSLEWENLDNDLDSLDGLDDSDDNTGDNTDDNTTDISWVENDSENIEMTRFNKKPNFIFDQIQINEYFQDDRFLMANLKMDNQINEDLKKAMLNYYKGFIGERNEFISLFSELFNVGIKTIEDLI